MPSRGRENPRAKFLKRAICSWESLAFLIYAAVTIYVTYPAITLTSRVHGWVGDPHGVLWSLWWYKYSFANRLPVDNMNMIAYPFGLHFGFYKTDPLTNVTLRFLSIASNETVAYNLFLIFSFLLNAIAMFYLVKYLTRSRAAGFFAGLAFGFCPYLQMRALSHLGLVNVMWIPIFALSLIRAWRRKTSGSILLCSLLFIVLTLYSYQYGLFAGFFAVVFSTALWLAGRPWKRKQKEWRQLWKYIVGATLILAILIPLYVVFTHTSRGTLDVRGSLPGLATLAARPWDYLVPIPSSTLFGWIPRNLPFGLATRANPRDVFLGYVPVALALYALVASLWRRKERKESTDESSDSTTGKDPDPVQTRSFDQQNDPRSERNSRRLIITFSVSGAFALIFSLPPTVEVFGSTLYTPSIIFTRLFPTFRVYDRLGLVVMFCVAVLAGYGIGEITRRGYFRGWRSVFFVLLCILVLLEFMIAPPFASLDTKETTDYYRWLRRQPKGTVAAIYPLINELYVPYGYEYQFQQRIHEKSMVNGPMESPVEAQRYWPIITDPWDPSTPGMLSRLGARYVLARSDLRAEKKKLQSVMADQSRIPPGLRLYKELNGCRVFVVDAKPTDFVSTFNSDNITTITLLFETTGSVWHPGGTESVIKVYSHLKKPTTCRLKFSIASIAERRSLAIDVNGKDLEATKISTRPAEVIVDNVRLNPKTNVLKLKSSGQLKDAVFKGFKVFQTAVMVSNIYVEQSQ